MNKKGNMYGLVFLIFIATILSALFVNVAIIQFGVTNDYVLFNLQNISEVMNLDGIVPNETINQTQSIADGFQETISWGDNLWFMIYLIFIILTILYAYRQKAESDYSFVAMMLLGIFILFFVGWITNVFVQWFTTNITLALLPTAFEYFPKYEWYVENAGIINAIHAVVLLLVTRLNFQFATRQNINKQELDALDNEEIN